MSVRSQRNISVNLETAQLIEELRDELSAKTDSRVTIADTVRRAVHCLRDAHNDRRWLTGAEAAVTMQRRHQETTVNVIGQLLARYAPDVKLNGVSFDAARSVVWLHTAGAEPTSMVIGSVNDVASPN